VVYEHDRVIVIVQDDGGPAAVAAARPTGTAVGRGLAGMRERVALLGGSITTEPSLSGGFLVRAELPAHGVRP
jgi:signal transduction histidine kinase